MYHVIDRPRSSAEARLCCPPENFAAQLDYLRRQGYTVQPLASLARSLREGTNLPRRSAVITFDDGSSCTYERALPILGEYGFPATVFMVSGLIGRDNDWLRGAGFPVRRMLSASELRGLDAGRIEVGSHSATHPWLSRIPLEQARVELKDSKAQLEDVIGRPVEHFAYPFGNYNDAVRSAVAEAGYSAACSTRWGKRHTEADLFALRRVEVMGQDSLLKFAWKLRVATNHMPPVPEARHLLRQGLEKMRILSPRTSRGI
jgi:peptidoglycan/xylan/chitin deacetylase (PgdA/CDA1 family)